MSLSIQDMVNRGIDKSLKYKNKKIESVFQKVDTRQISVPDVLTILKEICSINGITFQCHNTGKAFGQIKNWIKSWESPHEKVESFREYLNVMVKTWPDFCGSSWNTLGFIGNTLNLSLLLNSPKTQMKLHQFISNGFSDESAGETQDKKCVVVVTDTQRNMFEEQVRKMRERSQANVR